MSEVRPTMWSVKSSRPGQIVRPGGVLTTSELLAAGWSEQQLRTLIKRADLVAVGRGAYAPGERARKLLSLAGGDQLLAITAAIAVVGPGAVVSHQSAAYLHEIDLVGRSSTAVLTCPPARGWRGRQGVQIHAVALPADQVTDVLRLPVTTPARTVIDLARTLEFRAGVVAADSALHRALTTKQELRAVLAACHQWPGTRRAAEVVDFADGRAESPLESLGRVAFRDCGLPAPELQVWLGGTVEPIGRVDFYWRRYWTVAEVDGALKYRADPMRAREQLRRDALLRDDGFEVVHFTWQQITQTPQVVAASIRKAFERGVRNATRPAAAS